MRSEEQAGVARRQAAAIRPFSDPQVRFLLHDFVRLRSWNFANLAAPFWRLYWNPTPGASIRFKGVTHALAPARIYLLPPETGFAAALARPTDHWYVHFPLGRPDTGGPPQVWSLPRTAARARRLTRIRAHAVRGTLGYPAGALALMALVAELLAELPAAVWSMPLPDKRISRVLDWMETRGFAFPPGNRDLARVAGLSTNAFIRLFSSQVGLPPMRYLLNRRVDHAAILLQHTDGSLDQIAAACGFCDRFHFSRVFQTRHAMGPARYRRERLY